MILTYKFLSLVLIVSISIGLQNILKCHMNYYLTIPVTASMIVLILEGAHSFMDAKDEKK